MLPAHRRCHGGLPESWFRNLLVPLGAASGNVTALALYNSGPVRREYAESVGFRRETLAGLVPGEDRYTPGGV